MLNLGGLVYSMSIEKRRLAHKDVVLVFYKGAMRLYSLFQNSLQSLQNLSMN